MALRGRPSRSLLGRGGGAPSPVCLHPDKEHGLQQAMVDGAVGWCRPRVPRLLNRGLCLLVKFGKEQRRRGWGLGLGQDPSGRSTPGLIQDEVGPKREKWRG